MGKLEIRSDIPIPGSREHYEAAGRAIAELHLCISRTRCALEDGAVEWDEAIEDLEIAFACELRAREECVRFGEGAVRMAERYASLYRSHMA